MLIAQISDMHVTAEGTLLYDRIDTAGYLERAVAHVLDLDPRPDVVIATGDLVDGGKPEEYARLRRLLAPLPMPVYLIPGNHDARDPLRAAFPDHAYLPKDGFLQYTIEDHPLRLIALDTLVTDKPLRRAVREAAGLAGRASRRAPRRADAALPASPALRLRHRRLRPRQAQQGRSIVRRPRAPPWQCRARPLRTCPSPDPGALGGHAGLDRTQHRASGDTRPAGRRTALHDDGAAGDGAALLEERRPASPT